MPSHWNLIRIAFIGAGMSLAGGAVAADGDGPARAPLVVAQAEDEQGEGAFPEEAAEEGEERSEPGRETAEEAREHGEAVRERAQEQRQERTEERDGGQ